MSRELNQTDESTSDVPTQRVAVYIDGLNLYHGLLSKGFDRYLWTDLRLLSTNLSRPDQLVCRVKYFTARFVHEGGRPGAIARQGRYLEALDSAGGVQVVEGKFLQRLGRCKNCGEQWRTYEEKMTDVNLGIELVSDAVDGVFDVAILVSGDSDLTGPVTKVLDRNPNAQVVVAFPPNRSSKSLKSVATAYIAIGRGALRDSQLPDVVRAKGGGELRRPEEWR